MTTNLCDEHKMTREKMLTITIPTFNRKRALEKTLMSLEKQTNQFFRIIVVNNNSDYCIEDVFRNLSSDFQNRIELINRVVNVGQDINIMECFAFCKTKWLWTLSDDDELFDDAVDKIYRYIERMGEFGVASFTLAEDMPIEVGSIHAIKSIKEFNDLYDLALDEQSKWHGDLIFLSNKVFNMDIVEDYLLVTYKYIYTCISTVVLIGKLLEKEKTYIIVRDSIVKYGESEKKSWKMEYVVLGSRTLMDVPFEIPQKLHRNFLRNIVFDIWTVLYEDFSHEERIVSRVFYDEIYHGIYKYVLKGKRKLLLKVISKLNKSDCGRRIIKAFLSTKFKR